jgi:ADP-ribose pyrophosphatase YjhB (NUDIX family)
MLWATLLACAVTPSPCEPPGTQVDRARAAGCVVVVDDQLLLIRGSEGWSIPGGYVDGQEPASAAAARETAEEAGLAVRALSPTCASEAKAFVAFTCEPTGTLALRPDGRETTDARWFTAEALRALADDELRFPEQREAYERAFAR